MLRTHDVTSSGETSGDSGDTLCIREMSMHHVELFSAKESSKPECGKGIESRTFFEAYDTSTSGLKIGLESIVSSEKNDSRLDVVQ
jgi:hypothetical protein